ncbi:hypothetical protein PYCC9005_002289 [Savitreella phatthalungensis]
MSAPASVSGRAESPQARSQSPLPRADQIKLIASDVDGTLLDSNHRLHPRTFHAIRWLRDNKPDLPFVIATGKQHRSVAEIRGPLDLDRFHSSHLNGCVVYGPHAQVLADTGLSYETCVKLFDTFARERQISTYFYDYSTVYEIPGSEQGKYGRKLKQYGEDVRIVGEEVLEQIKQGKIRVIKAAICQSPGPGLESSRALLKSEFSPAEITLTQAIEFCIELIPTTGSKGIALAKILGTDIKPEEVIVFGDGENDVSMFRVAGHAVAMANAMPSAKANATFQAPLSNDQGGVGQILETIFGFDYEEKPYDYWLEPAKKL